MKLNKLLLLSSILLGISLVSCKDNSMVETKEPEVILNNEDNEPLIKEDTNLVEVEQEVNTIDYKKYNLPEDEFDNFDEYLNSIKDIKFESSGPITPPGLMQVKQDQELFLTSYVSEEGYLGVYSLVANKDIVAPMYDPLTTEITFLHAREGYGLIQIKEENKLTFIDIIGNLVYETTFDKPYEVSLHNDDLIEGYSLDFMFDEKIVSSFKYYYEEDKVVEYEKERDSLLAEPRIIDLKLFGHEGLYAYLNNNNLCIYDKNGNLVTLTNLKVSENTNITFIIKDYCFYQEVINVNPFSEDYDFIFGDEFLKIRTYKINYLTKERKEVNFNKLIRSTMPLKNNLGIYDASLLRVAELDDKCYFDDKSTIELIVNEDLEVLEDVTKYTFTDLVRFKDKIFSEELGVVYDLDFNILDLVPPLINDIDPLRENYVVEDYFMEKYGLVSFDNEVILETNYDDIIYNYKDHNIFAIRGNILYIYDDNDYSLIKTISFDDYSILKFDSQIYGVTLIDLEEIGGEEFPIMTVYLLDGTIKEFASLTKGIPVTGYQNDLLGSYILKINLLYQTIEVIKMIDNDYQIKTYGTIKVNEDKKGESIIDALELKLGENTLTLKEGEANSTYIYKFKPTKTGLYDIKEMNPIINDVGIIKNSTIVSLDHNFVIDGDLYLKANQTYYFGLSITEDTVFNFNFIKDYETYDGSKLEVTLTKEDTSETYLDTYYFKPTSSGLYKFNYDDTKVKMNIALISDTVYEVKPFTLFSGERYLLNSNQTYLVRFVTTEENLIINGVNKIEANFENSFIVDKEDFINYEEESKTYKGIIPADFNGELLVIESPYEGLFGTLSFDLEYHIGLGDTLYIETEFNHYELEGVGKIRLESLIVNYFVLGANTEANYSFNSSFRISNISFDYVELDPSII